eukprot:3942000-Rhodomonas_salina.6
MGRPLRTCYAVSGTDLAYCELLLACNMVLTQHMDPRYCPTRFNSSTGQACSTARNFSVQMSGTAMECTVLT